MWNLNSVLFTLIYKICKIFKDFKKELEKNWTTTWTLYWWMCRRKLCCCNHQKNWFSKIAYLLLLFTVPLLIKLLFQSSFMMYETRAKNVQYTTRKHRQTENTHENDNLNRTTQKDENGSAIQLFQISKKNNDKSNEDILIQPIKLVKRKHIIHSWNRN